MKLKYFLLLCSLSLVLFSCKDENLIKIDSLQVFGDEFYYGETVNIGMAVNLGDPDNTSYYWECDGGTLLNRQGYTLNQWKAPRKAGIYKVKCTVTCGNEKQTREADILVSGFFFQRFDALEGTNTVPTGWAQTSSTVQIRNKRLEVSATTAGQDHGEVRYPMGQSNMFPPFSLKADVGIVGTNANTFTPKYPNSDMSNPNTFASKYPTKDNFSSVSITGKTVSTDTVTHFINELRVEFYPEKDHVQSVMKYLPVGGIPGNAADSLTIAKADFDAILRFQWTQKANIAGGVPQVQAWYSIPFKSAMLVYGVEQSVNIGLSVDGNYVVSVSSNGTEIFNTDALRTWRQSKNNKAVWSADAFKYMYPANTRVFLDNVMAFLGANFDK